VNSREILRRLVRRFGLLILLTLIGGIAGAVYSAVKTPTYTAKAYVVAIGDKGDPISALNFAQAYGRVATSGPLLAMAGATLGANRTGLTQVTASTSPDAPVIEITATGPAAKHTADLANAVANALADYGTARKDETHVSLALLAGATTPQRPSSPQPPLELVVGAAAGLLIGGLAVLAGVGRSSATRDQAAPEQTESTAVRVEVAEVDEPAAQPAEFGRYTGVARTQHLPKAITSYRVAAAPSYLDAEEEGRTRVNPPIPGQRIVGRAAVAGMEEDQ